MSDQSSNRQMVVEQGLPTGTLAFGDVQEARKLLQESLLEVNVPGKAPASGGLKAQDLGSENDELGVVLGSRLAPVVRDWADSLCHGQHITAQLDAGAWSKTLVSLDASLDVLELQFPQRGTPLALPLMTIAGMDLPFTRSPGARFQGEDRILHLEIRRSAGKSAQRVGFQFARDQDRLLFALTLKMLRADACAAEMSRARILGRAAGQPQRPR